MSAAAAHTATEGKQQRAALTLRHFSATVNAGLNVTSLSGSLKRPSERTRMVEPYRTAVGMYINVAMSAAG